ncbi:WbqC family protein [Acidobacteria bacterium AH-259-L09]|nr:WbqC family protein [Acidobacteria bacterium AH-259-L09]
MRACIHQPDFLPYIGFFHRLFYIDAFIILDTVQFRRRFWHHRNRIRNRKGAFWLTVPVKALPRGEAKINKVQIDKSQHWVTRHLRALEFNYRRTPCFERIFPPIQSVYKAGHSYLAAFNELLIRTVVHLLELDIPFYHASSVPVSSSSNLLLIDLCKAVGANEYLTGDGATGYLDVGLFRQSGIRVFQQNFLHPLYTQQHGDFIGHLSIVDLLFNMDREGAAQTVAQSGIPTELLP